MAIGTRPEQRATAADAVAFLRGAERGQRRMYFGPTGVGKSYVEADVLEALPEAALVTNRAEIVDGMVAKGVPRDRVFTATGLRNRLASGKVDAPRWLVVDECHHHGAPVWQEVGLMCGDPPSVGFTGTPYCGTPRATKALLDLWGPPVPIITWGEARALGRIAWPEFSVLPLVDDDVVEVGAGGDFQVASLEAHTVDRLGDLVVQSRPWRCQAGLWDLATLFAVPSRGVGARLASELQRDGAPAVLVDVGSSAAVRRAAFEALKAGLAVVHVDVVTEGVDLPIRRLVDLAPTLSPRRWVQQLGRAMRPWDRRPQYVGTNRNLSRHAYVFEGLVAEQSIAAVDKAFGPSSRACTRALGMEALGRFKPAVVRMASGASAQVYSLTSSDSEGKVVEYCCVVRPSRPRPDWATRERTASSGVYPKWRRCEPPEEVVGFQSTVPNEPTEKQSAWWRRSAARFGFDPAEQPDRKGFVALPVLTDLCNGGR